MAMIDKKYSKDNDPEIPKDRIIDALRAGNKLSVLKNMEQNIISRDQGKENLFQLV